MTRRITRKRPALLAAFALLLPLLIGVAAGQAPASATTAWPQELSNIAPDELLSSPDGGVSLGRCSAPTQDRTLAAQSFDSSAQAVSSVVGYETDLSFSFCQPHMAVGKDGTLYGVNWSTYGIEAFRGSNRVFPAVSFLTRECSGYYVSSEVRGITIGSDGDVYVVVYNHGCTNRFHLMGIDTQTGTEKFRVLLQASDYGQFADYGSYVKAFHGGVIARDGNDFRYFSNEGAENTALRYNYATERNEEVSLWEVNLQGDLFFVVSHHDSYRMSPCDANSITRKVIKSAISGEVTTYNVEPFCLPSDDLKVTPSGGALIVADTKREGTGYDNPLVLLGTNGSVMAINPPLNGYLLHGQHGISASVDGNGNIVFMRRVINPAAYGDSSSEVHLLSPEGREITRYSTEQFIDTVNGSRDYAYTSNGGNGNGIATANGYAYTILCGNYYSGCREPKLHRVLFGEVGMDYPRGAILGVAPRPIKHLVAMGDSFSSGEGVPDFIDDTDVEGQNQCHRSKSAYARLLDADPQLNLQLDHKNFAACSGATTGNITGHGQWDEPGQLDALGSETDLVTLTIGGNDVYFADFVEACLVWDCTQGSVVGYDTVMYNIDTHLGEKLKSTYSAIGNRLKEVGSSARVLVVGYPFVVRMGDGACSLADQLSVEEQHAAELVTVKLNRVIANTVKGMNDQRFTFIEALSAESPFEGHDMCGDSPFFNDYSIWHPKVFTAHPNRRGQGAYAELIKRYLLATQN